jgi:uncharacterized membrane protein (TIGR02234 family)
MSGQAQQPAQPGAERREYRGVLLLLAVAAVLLFVGYAQTWASAVVRQDGLPTVEVVLKGRDIEPAASASAILALAGIAGLVATRRLGRAVTGVLLALEGVLAAYGAISFGLSAGGRADVLELVAERVGVAADAEVSVSPWWLAVALGGLMLVVVGVLAVARGGRWPVLGRRYEARTGEQRAPASAGPSAPTAAGSAAAWDALDRGVDPTVGGADDGGADDGGADEQARPGPDTMTQTDAQEDPR